MPDVGVKLDRWVGPVDVILLDGFPGGYDSAAYMMAPANSGLVNGELAVNLGIVGKFGMRGAAGIEIRPDAC